MALILLAVASVAAIRYLLGRATPLEPVAQPTREVESQKAAAPPVQPTKSIVPSMPQEVPTELSVSALKPADSQKLDMGCACGFSVGKTEYLAVSANTAIFRVEGTTKICPISEQAFDDFYGDEGSFKCGNVSVSISGRGEVGPGFDGHSRKANLRIAKGPLLKVMTGKWLCGC